MINWEWTEKDSEFLYELSEKLRDETPFAFSRWGDGEWATLTHNHTPIDKKDEIEMASTLSKYNVIWLTKVLPNRELLNTADDALVNL